jgi:glutamate/tyrosine decarboxylase-like PLP-dependent enzyme
MPAHVREALKASPPRSGIGITAALERAQTLIFPYGTGNLHPRFWGWVIGAGSLPGILGQWLATAMNANAWAGDQGPAQLELQLLAWLREWFEFPADSSGLLLDGASSANMIGLAIARHRSTHGAVKAAGLYALPTLCVYASDQVHNSLVKAAELLGLGAQALRLVPSLPDGRADLAAIERAIEADRALGLQPCCIVASAGTVATGAIDPLVEMHALAQRHELWFHIDAAIGGIAWLSPQLRPRFAGLALADSLAFDLHKWAQVPYDAGCLLVRDGALHRATFEVQADYLGALSGGLIRHGAPAFNALGPQLSRADRALKIWLSLQALGTERIAAVFEKNVAQAQLLAALARDTPSLEVVAPVHLNIVCMRVRAPEGSTPEAADAINQGILVALQESGRAMLSPVRWQGRFCLRASICNRWLVHELDRLASQI